MRIVREPAVAGMFYPSSQTKLRKEIESLFGDTETQKKYKGILGVIAPHAGYTYSGKTAALAYSLLRDQNFKRVIILSPSHREYFPGISGYSGDAYKTPLGEVDVDKDFIDKLVAGEQIIFKGQNGHRGEHALEVQLPFLQSVLKEFKIIPIVMGDQRKIFCEKLAKKIFELLDDSTLIIASSDLSHFHSKNKALILDKIVEDKIIQLDDSGLIESLDSNECEACGGGPISVMLKIAKLREMKVEILAHSDSGDVTGDDTEVVGYLSAIFFKESF